jgi:uncharacterized protein (DUF1810 family)
MSAHTTDPYELSRFVDAQEECYATAVEELRSGAKQSHWMWFVFPQVAGLGFSSMAQQYAIRSRLEAEAYLAHPILGPRLTACAEALLGVHDRSAEQIMGFPDVLKLQSSMTLFSEVSSPGSVFERVLEKYYGGEKDKKTIRYIS